MWIRRGLVELSTKRQRTRSCSLRESDGELSSFLWTSGGTVLEASPERASSCVSCGKRIKQRHSAKGYDRGHGRRCTKPRRRSSDSPNVDPLDHSRLAVRRSCPQALDYPYYWEGKGTNCGEGAGKSRTCLVLSTSRNSEVVFEGRKAIQQVIFGSMRAYKISSATTSMAIARYGSWIETALALVAYVLARRRNCRSTRLGSRV